MKVKGRMSRNGGSVAIRKRGIEDEWLECWKGKAGSGGKGGKLVPGLLTAEAAACPNHVAPESGVQGENFTTEHKALVWHLAFQTDSSAVPWMGFFFLFVFLFSTSAVTQQFKTCKSGSSHLCLKAKGKREEKKKKSQTNIKRVEMCER